ncbi:MAG: hypothetical protein EWV91_09965 [Microcystis aeruginosa Ma_QC_Ca_00000000_S207]|uniref:Flagellar assembly protein H n=1 Tax=Microcystis aeruginosa Ma_QC_Ca_00000000_S207 TaxID=2486251 RepID=A0A552FMV4_MICAE|nr:MAG: hypothetical protein EWV91_09965 [Microcystis aeruginosa Ma_QC_Ca_00000000_S207]
MSQKQVQSNLAAATSILAGLVLNRETIKKILRSDIMREKEEGKEEGKEEKARQIALKMLSAGFPVPEIARFTDLSPDAIEELQRQQHN